jgi:hypothetical protein
MQLWGYPNKLFMLVTIFLLTTCAALSFPLDKTLFLVTFVPKVLSWNFGLQTCYSD